MIAPRLEWLLPEPVPDPPAFDGFSPPVAVLLARRGFRTNAELRRFLDAGVADLHPVSAMADADVALARLEAALASREPIAIWGDYDADGMTAVAIFVLALRALGADPRPYIPSRLEEGYGLSRDGLLRLAHEGVRLVVTCDCGVGNVDEVAYAHDLGLEVVVTDHHLPSALLPAAVAVVDPHRPDCRYPDPDLTGAGIAFKLAGALLARAGTGIADLAALAAIGAVADMAPMTGESRAIVRLGLAELGETARPGLRALLQRSAEVPTTPTARDLAFGLAPRLNAAGRIADAELGLGLLLAGTEDEAAGLADELERVYGERRALTAVALTEARALAQAWQGDGPVALRHDGWAAGLLGLIAGRLMDDLARPVAVAALVGDEVRGSIRAPAGFRVDLALDALRDHLTKSGGHAAAGGFSLAPASWDAFAAGFAQLAGSQAGQTGRTARAGQYEVDLVLPAHLVGWSLADELQRLAPFGPGHEEPRLAVHGLVVGEARRMGADGTHLGLKMRRGLETVDAVAFGMLADRPVPGVGDRIDLVGTLERTRFEGEPRLRLRVDDYADAMLSALRARRSAPTVGSR